MTTEVIEMTEMNYNMIDTLYLWDIIIGISIWCSLYIIYRGVRWWLF